jgi:light-regulated signal transduction histidine kinase (bacteriophytochrome)
LAETAKAVSERKDYNVRATKVENDELGSLTDAFNQMLTVIHKQTMELNEFNRNLEQKVQDRTEELEISNKELASFSYSVSHDLRAPVRAIDSYTRIFLEEHGQFLNEEGLKLLSKVIRNSEKMGMLIDDLLTFSHLGRKELVRADLDMNALVQEIWNELTVDLPTPPKLSMDPLPHAFAERPTMIQVWTNLISNAIKYSRNMAEPTVHISGKKTDKGEVYCIRDNGSGFDMTYYDKLFGVFQRLHSQHEFEGTGVGLAIVERIISRHGGKIWAESKVGEGAEFWFVLPSKPKKDQS